MAKKNVDIDIVRRQLMRKMLIEKCTLLRVGI